MNETTVVRAEHLRAFGAQILCAAGVPDEDAGTAADALIWSDLRGAFTHGITFRVPLLASRIRAGGTNPRPSWATSQITVSAAVLDADHGCGQVAGTRAMRLAVEFARTAGIGVVVVRDADSAGSMAWYPSVAVRERMIGLAINNTHPLMAAWGGATKVLGNQAFAIGCPAGRYPPILFDSAVTKMSNSGVNQVKRRGEQLPPGVALDEEGRPTTDPAAALAGIMLPMGDHRGYGLALMWEVLTGVLSGGRIAKEVGGLMPHDAPPGHSLFCLAINPELSLPYQQFVDRVDTLIGQILASPPAAGVDRVRVPGHRGAELAALHEIEGIPVPSDRLDELHAAGAVYGIQPGKELQ